MSERTPAEIAAPYFQCWADSRHSGVRHGPVHLYSEGNEYTAVALCGRRVKLWNMEGETEEDFCPRCIRVARTKALSWTKDNGEIVGLAYVQRRALSHLSSRWRTLYSVTARRTAVANTLGSERWLQMRNGETVGALVRDVEDNLVRTQMPSKNARHSPSVSESRPHK